MTTNITNETQVDLDAHLHTWVETANEMGRQAEAWMPGQASPFSRVTEYYEIYHPDGKLAGLILVIQQDEVDIWIDTLLNTVTVNAKGSLGIRAFSKEAADNITRWLSEP